MESLIKQRTAVLTAKHEFNQYLFNSLLRETDYDVIYAPFQSEIRDEYDKIYVVGTEACSYLNEPALFKNSYNYIVLPTLPKNSSDLSYQFTLGKDVFLPIKPLLEITELPAFLYLILQFSGVTSFLSIYDNTKKSSYHHSGYLSKNEIELLINLSNNKTTIVTLDSKLLYKNLLKLGINYAGQILDTNLLYYSVTGEATTSQELLKTYNYYWNPKLTSKNIHNIYTDLYYIAEKRNKLELYKNSILIKNILLEMEVRGLNLSKNKESYNFYVQNKDFAINGKFHPYYNQQTSSGRIYANTPPVTNTPRTERSLYVTHNPAKRLFSMDFNQLEYRVIASLLNYEPLISGFNANIDFHTSTAMIIYGQTDPDKITIDQRQQGKQLNFSILYGASEKKALADVPADAVTKVRETFTLITEKKTTFLDSIRTDKVITTPFGREAKFNKLDGETRRRVFNFFIQSTATDIVLQFLIKLKQKMAVDKKDIVVYDIIHDSLVLELAEKDIQYIVETATNIVETELKFDWLKTKLILKFEE